MRRDRLKTGAARRPTQTAPPRPARPCLAFLCSQGSTSGRRYHLVCESVVFHFGQRPVSASRPPEATNLASRGLMLCSRVVLSMAGSSAVFFGLHVQHRTRNRRTSSATHHSFPASSTSPFAFARTAEGRRTVRTMEEETSFPFLCLLLGTFVQLS